MRWVAGILVALGLSSPALGAGLGLVPDDAAPGPGATLTIAVDLDATSVGCFSFSVEYDDAVLEYLGASEGALFGNSAELTWFSDDVDALGRPQPNDCVLGFGTSVTGPGTIATLSFQVLTADPTTVTLRDITLRDVDRIEILGVQDTSVFLNATGTGTPAGSFGVGLVPSPNPSSSRVSLVLTGAPAANGGRVSILDVAGRLVRELDWPARTANLEWDGRDREGRPVANGIYLARFVAGPRWATTRIVRVR